MSNKHSIYRTISTGNGSCFKLYANFEEDSLSLLVLTVLEALATKLCLSDIKEQAKIHQQKTEEYFSKLKDYIMNPHDGIDLKLYDNKLVMSMALKNSMKITLFSCELRTINYNGAVVNLLDTIHNEHIQVVKKLDEVIKEKNELERSKAKYEEKLNDFVTIKEQYDQELYNNFVTLLNEKKLHIQHLNELLIAFRKGRSTTNPPVEVKKKRNTKRQDNTNLKANVKVKIEQQIKEESASDSDSSYNTDNEKQLQNSDSDSSNASPKPGPSRCLDLLFDTSPTHSLPKRIKLEPEAFVENELNQPSTSKETSSVKENSNNENSRNSPSYINFDTQDLLDAM